MKRQERTRGGSGGKRAGLAAVDTKAVKFPTQFESVLSRFRENAGPIISKSLPCYKNETIRNPLFSNRVLDWVLHCGKQLRAFVAMRLPSGSPMCNRRRALAIEESERVPFGMQSAILSLKRSGIPAEPSAATGSPRPVPWALLSRYDARPPGTGGALRAWGVYNAVNPPPLPRAQNVRRRSAPSFLPLNLHGRSSVRPTTPINWNI